MGLFSSSDRVEGFPWCRKIVDEILIWASNLSDLECSLCTVLERCVKLHVTLSRCKFQVDTKLKFTECVERVQPDPDPVSALASFPVPVDQTGVRSFLGLCN